MQTWHQIKPLKCMLTSYDPKIASTMLCQLEKKKKKKKKKSKEETCFLPAIKASFEQSSQNWGSNFWQLFELKMWPYLKR